MPWAWNTAGQPDHHCLSSPGGDSVNWHRLVVVFHQAHHVGCLFKNRLKWFCFLQLLYVANCNVLSICQCTVWMERHQDKFLCTFYCLWRISILVSLYDTLTQMHPCMSLLPRCILVCHTYQDVSLYVTLTQMYPCMPLLHRYIFVCHSYTDVSLYVTLTQMYSCMSLLPRCILVCHSYPDVSLYVTLTQMYPCMPLLPRCILVCHSYPGVSLYVTLTQMYPCMLHLPRCILIRHTYPDEEGSSTSTGVSDLVRGVSLGHLPGLLSSLHGNGSGVELRDLPHHRLPSRLRHQRLARPPLLQCGPQEMGGSAGRTAGSREHSYWCQIALCTSFPVPHLQPYSVQISPRRFVPQVSSAFIQLADPPFLLCSPSPVSIRTACRSSLPTLFPHQHSHRLQISPSHSLLHVPRTFL